MHCTPDDLRNAKRLVCRYIYRNPRLTSHLDDMVQEAMIGFMAARRAYRDGMGTTFKTFAYRGMQMWILRYIKRLAKRSELPASALRRTEDTQTAYDVHPDDSPSPERVAAARHEVDWFLTDELPRRIRKSIPEGSRAVAAEMARERCQGDLLREVGERHGVSRERVRQITAKLGLVIPQDTEL